MSDDLVRRLRATRYDKDNCPRMDSERVGTPKLCEEAATRIQELEAEVERLKWQPIETAPKDRPILAWCDAEHCGNSDCSFSGGQGSSLCLYHGHADGLSFAETGWHIVEWGGAWDDNTFEYRGGSMPDWWFVRGTEFEQSANPTHWMPLLEPPARQATGDSNG